jgi:hypothetical protein
LKDAVCLDNNVIPGFVVNEDATSRGSIIFVLIVRVIVSLFRWVVPEYLSKLPI